MDRRQRFRVWAATLLVVTVAVILWGAFVRVTGSGAGCAEHWPLCNGELVPRSPKLETIIELTHRVTSGLAGILALGLFVAARRTYARRSPVRRAAGAALLLMVVEGAIGALLVKQGLVAEDASSARAFVVGLHLCNTFLLLGAQVLTLYFARGGAPLALREKPGLASLLALLALLMLVLGGTGAVTALGDTLFPAASLSEGIAQDLAPGAHFLVKLRVWHPLFAVLGGAIVVYAAQQLRVALGSPQVARWALAVTLLYLLQLAVGSLNLLLLAPAPIQITHLLLADLLWIALMFMSAHALAARPAGAQLSCESAAS